MTTSGVKAFTLTTGDIIDMAFQKAMIFTIRDTIPSADYDIAKRNLNVLVKSWQSYGYNIWNDKRATLFLQYGVNEYELGSNGYHCTENYVRTSLISNVSSGAGTIQVSSSEGISDGDFIGIIKDDNYIFWTNVDGAPVANTIALVDNIDGNAASGKDVFAYTTKISKPLEILNVMLEQTSTNEIILYKIPRQKYFWLSNKNSLGNPNQYYYKPEINKGRLFVWSTPIQTDQVINFTFQPDFDNFVNVSDTPDFPQQWLNAIIYNLAYQLMTDYGITTEQMNRVKADADRYLNLAQGSDNDDGTLRIVPSYRNNRRWL